MRLLYTLALVPAAVNELLMVEVALTIAQLEKVKIAIRGFARRVRLLPDGVLYARVVAYGPSKRRS